MSTRQPAAEIDLSSIRLAEQALLCNEGIVAGTGALTVTPETRTRHSPQNRFIVRGGIAGIPVAVPDIATAFLNPREAWPSPAAYDAAAARVAGWFVNSIRKFKAAPFRCQCRAAALTERPSRFDAAHQMPLDGASVSDTHATRREDRVEPLR